ncbi:MAG: aspartate/glutamate racemase family protein [Alphaproteobacteria bacterium]|nr:aspartate/glutamate racemase family protein [Alphaproteobacteria bacterium]
MTTATIGGKRIIGVLGGMGPLATVDFMRKVIEATPATKDQEHIPIVVWSVPQIPDRSASIYGKGESPLPMMQDGIRRLEQIGAGCIAIACNTAHYWYEEMRRGSSAKLLHIGETTAEGLVSLGIPRGPVGLIATDATIETKIYQDRLGAHGYDSLVLPKEDTDRLFWPAVRKVKANDTKAAVPLLEEAVERLVAAGATRVVLGCTEVPIGLAEARREIRALCFDATDALALACVAWASAETAGAP